MVEIINEIRQELPGMELRENEEMRRHCSFKIGGPARAMAFPASVEELQALYTLLKRAGVDPLMIGNGTNLLITDEPLDRFVIKMSDKFSHAERRSDRVVYALSGITLARLANLCADYSLAGLEFAHGIPGTLGGAASMNAGAYGGEMKDVLRTVTYLDEDGRLREKRGSELDLRYRHSVFSDTGCVIVGCELELEHGNPEDIRAKMSELAERRRASQPLDKPSAGSTFKRPEKGYAAALIDEAGLRGFAIGGAQVSEKHAGFVINKGGARFNDVLALMSHIKKTVYDRSGIMLEPEVKIIENARL